MLGAEHSVGEQNSQCLSHHGVFILAGEADTNQMICCLVKAEIHMARGSLP